MKSLIALAVLSTVLAACGQTSTGSSTDSASAAAHAPKLYTMDLRSEFKDQEINMMGDDMPAVSGLKILVPAIAAAVKVEITMDGAGSCTVLAQKDHAGGSEIDLQTDPETDDGTCNVAVSLDDGRKAVIQVTSQGT